VDEAPGDPPGLGRPDHPQWDPDRAGRANGGRPWLRRHRRVERGRATIDALPRIADAVGSKVPVLFGSGVRTGPDVYRALALGAEAVFIGRPYVYGLALRGENGVRHMLRTLLAELDIDLAIAGDVATLRRLGPDALVRD
jgi:lactate 2-monooxygenase